MTHLTKTNTPSTDDHQPFQSISPSHRHTPEAYIIKRPLPAVPTILSIHPSQPSHSYHHHHHPPSSQPSHQFQPPHYPQCQPPRNQSSPNQIRNPLPHHVSSHPTQSISHGFFEKPAQPYYPIPSLSRSLSTQYQPHFSPKRNLPNLPTSNNPIPFNQTRDVTYSSITNRMTRTGSLQGARPLPNRGKDSISNYQTLISNSSKPLPAPPSSHRSHQELQPNLINHQELQPIFTHSIKPFTSPSKPTPQPPGISISSVPKVTVKPTVPVLNIVGRNEESEEESFNESKPSITLSSTSEPNSVSVPIPIIITEEDESLKNFKSNQSNLNERSIQVPTIPTETLSNPTRTPQPEPISSSSSSNPTQTTKPEPISSSSSSSIETNSIQSLFCGGCHQIIAGRIVNALNQRWHPDCFKCEHCEMVLEHVAFYEHLGKAYCGVDYDEFFSLKCHHCNTSITDESYVTLDEPSLPNGPRHYHQLHLFCAECGDPFLNPKLLEESSKISKLKCHHHQEEEVKVIEPNPFVLYKGYPYCEKCHLRLHKPKCFGCKLSMTGDIINAMGKQWHEDCFVCKGCKNPFLNGMFFLDHGNPFCEECYSILLKHTF